MDTTTDSPVILLGSQRSGTTAFAYALSDAYAKADGIFTVNGKLMYFLHRWLTDGDINVRHFRVDEILHSLHRRIPGGEGSKRWLEQVERVLRKAAEEVADGLHNNALALGRTIVAESYTGYTRWGDKYNEYLHHLSHLDEIIPDARYIILFRSPNDSVASILEWTGDRPWRPSTVDSNLEKWALWHSEVFRLLEKLPKKRYLVTEYNSLCKGEETIRLSEFVGLDLEPHLRFMSQRRKPTDHPVLPARVKEIWIRLKAYHEK
ncbi:sulfotransferase [Paenibacillus sp. MZ04-78.2]|uniref:sulfotransferase n=1 Tax=Paenibacillus sp. MZ04-78.2 TaxID=2962034 RepID=UPI0020B65E85|nr:sulfotransferase [Paenibacillus sp. MZ04-78.2]MCP3776520.1 sulfotransferase [Paenibacillus sp. MZ04-78.2]